MILVYIVIAYYFGKTSKITHKHLRTAGVVQPFCITDTVECGAEIQYFFYSKALSVLNVSTCWWGPYLRRRFSEGGVY